LGLTRRFRTNEKRVNSAHIALHDGQGWRDGGDWKERFGDL